MKSILSFTRLLLYISLVTIQAIHASECDSFGHRTYKRPMNRKNSLQHSTSCKNLSTLDSQSSSGTSISDQDQDSPKTSPTHPSAPDWTRLLAILKTNDHARMSTQLLQEHPKPSWKLFRLVQRLAQTLEHKQRMGILEKQLSLLKSDFRSVQRTKRKTIRAIHQQYLPQVARSKTTSSQPDLSDIIPLSE